MAKSSINQKRYIEKDSTAVVMNKWRNRCALCGSPEVEINHKKHWAKMGSSSSFNLIPLCGNHHSLYGDKGIGKQTPSGAHFLTLEDLKDLSKDTVASKDKEIRQLNIRDDTSYTIQLGSFILHDAEEILTFGDRPIIELYRDKAVGYATTKSDFFSLRFFDKNGNWIGAIIRNYWCGIKDVVIDQTAPENYLKVSVPESDVFLELTIVNDVITITGKFWWKGREVIIQKDSITIGKQLIVDRGMLQGSLRGIIFDDEDNMYLGDRFRLGKYGSINVGSMALIYEPYGDMLSVFTQKGIPLNVAQKQRHLISYENPDNVRLASLAFPTIHKKEFMQVNKWLKDTTLLKENNWPRNPLLINSKHHQYSMVYQYWHMIGFIDFADLVANGSVILISFLFDRDTRKKDKEVTVKHVVTKISQSYQGKPHFLTVIQKNNKQLLNILQKNSFIIEDQGKEQILLSYRKATAWRINIDRFKLDDLNVQEQTPYFGLNND